MQQRIEYIDIAKGIGMMLVVIGHLVDGKSALGLSISSFHMPLFFILSGLCFNEAKWPQFKPFLVRRIKTLAVPLLLFSVLVHCAKTSLGMVDYSIIDISQFRLPGAGWFVLVLFFAELIYFPLNKALTVTPPLCKTLLTSVFLVMSIILDRQGMNYPFYVCSIPIGIFFYAIGHQARPYISKIMKKSSGVWLSLLFIASPIVIALATHNSLDLSSNHIPFPIVMRVACACLATMGILSLCKRYSEIGAIRQKKVVLWIGKNTLPILLLHMFFISFSCHFIEPHIGSHLVYKAIELMFVVSAVYACVRFINAKARWMVGK